MQEENQAKVEESLARKLWLFILDTGQTVIFAGGIFLVIYVFLFRPFQVSGDSMYSSFQNNEYILTNVIELKFHDPNRGDVIVFQSPTDPSRDFIKRVIAVPGDKLYVEDGAVFVNDKKVDESMYLQKGIETNPGAFLSEGEERTVGPDNYVVMGDNRINSSDSREWGFLPKENIKGISFLVYWPFNHMRIIKNPFSD